jgi:hypothetical protein
VSQANNHRHVQKRFIFYHATTAFQYKKLSVRARGTAHDRRQHVARQRTTSLLVCGSFAGGGGGGGSAAIACTRRPSCGQSDARADGRQRHNNAPACVCEFPLTLVGGRFRAALHSYSQRTIMFKVSHDGSCDSFRIQEQLSAHFIRVASTR